MRCTWACVIAAGLAGQSAAFAFDKLLNGKDTEFLATLSPEQQAVYREVIRERCMHARTGYLVGILIAFVLCDRRYAGQCRLSNLLECEFVAIALGVASMTYLVLPKTTYMAYHLTSKAQMSAWMDMYRKCQGLMLGGTVLGAGLYHLAVCQLSD